MPVLDWIGKKAVVDHHKQVPFHLLKCNKELSIGDPGSGNIVVQGDNLVALKALIPYYAGTVKFIYIDPPYNTGNESWIYNDNVGSPEIQEWLGKAVGKELEDLTRHDKWLCMMYPRLVLLKEFLREDGIIFVSIDNNEFRYLSLLMDEIFGGANHLETLIWKKSYGGGSKSKHIVNQHEYILCFAKNKSLIPIMELPPDEKALKYYKYQDSKFEERGPFRLQPLATNSMDERPNLRYAIEYNGEEIWPEKQWQWSKERVIAAIENDGLTFTKKAGKWTVSYKQYLKDPEGEERGSKAYSIIEGIYTQQGTNEIKGMFGDGKAFSFPKPTKLIQMLIQLTTEKNDLILDAFAGSGTTGQAVMAANAADGGNRKFVLIEMDTNICSNVTAKRLQHVINGYGDTPATEGAFRFCELGHPLFDSDGFISKEVKFADLAHHIFFVATGEPLPPNSNLTTPLIGTARDTAIYLLYNGILGDETEEGGNVLTRDVLAKLPKHDGPKVVFGNGCLLGTTRLTRENIIFKQIPYEVRG